MKTMIKWSLLLLLCLMPLQLCVAKVHNDAGYSSVRWAKDVDGVRLYIERMHIYNYDGDNSHFSSDGKITVYVGEDEHVFYFSEMSSNSDPKKNFYYDGEGDEDQYKGFHGFPVNLYLETRNGIKVRGFFQDQHNEEEIEKTDAMGYVKGTHEKWCVATLVIKVFTQSSFAINLSATWRDHSDGVNDDHEKVDWTFNYYQSGYNPEDAGGEGGTTDIGTVELLDVTEAEYYDLSGCRLDGPRRGTNIVKRGGKMQKVIIR